MKCDYCGKNIGLLAVRYTWIDKEKKIAVHDNCLERYKKNIEKREKSIEEPADQKEDSTPAEKMVFSKILGILILLIITPAFIFSLYVFFFLAHNVSYFTILVILMYLLCIFLGIELIRVKKKGGYYQFLLIFGILIFVILIINIVISLIASMYVYFSMNG